MYIYVQHMCVCSVYDGSYSSSSSNNPATELLLYIEQNHLYMVVVATCQNPRCLVNMDVLDLLFYIRICWQKSYIYETNFFIQSYIYVYGVYTYMSYWYVRWRTISCLPLFIVMYTRWHFSPSLQSFVYIALYIHICVYSEKENIFYTHVVYYVYIWVDMF